MENGEDKDEEKAGHFAEKFEHTALEFVDIMDINEVVIDSGHKTADTDTPDNNTGKERGGSGFGSEGPEKGLFDFGYHKIKKRPERLFRPENGSGGRI